MALRVSIIPGTLSTQALVEGPSSKWAWSMLFSVRWLLSLIALPSGWQGEVRTCWIPRERRSLVQMELMNSAPIGEKSSGGCQSRG